MAELQSAEDIRSIGVVGNGYVGSAVARGFMEHAEVKVYDIEPNKKTHELEEVLETDVVFVCLPTPASSGGMTTDLTCIYDFFEPLDGIDTTFVIKSTVPVGTTRFIFDRFGIARICHSPEFLTARCHIADFMNPARTIVGCINKGFSHDPGYGIADLLSKRFPGRHCYVMSCEESEMVKYVTNCFFAMKIAFFNEVRAGCAAYNKLQAETTDSHVYFPMDFDSVLEAVLADGRIAISHHQVPGHDGIPGFGGSCLPKDIASFIGQMEEWNFDPILLQGVWDSNKNVRGML